MSLEESRTTWMSLLDIGQGSQSNRISIQEFIGDRQQIGLHDLSADSFALMTARQTQHSGDEMSPQQQVWALCFNTNEQE